MSMFDTIRCEYPLLGNPGAEIQFQTQSLGGFFDDFKIGSDGQLHVSDYDVEDRSDPKATGIARLFGSISRIHKEWKPYDFTGTLNFYGSKNAGKLFLLAPTGKVTTLDDEGKEIEVPKVEWFEYNAKFEKGKLISVERISTL